MKYNRNFLVGSLLIFGSLVFAAPSQAFYLEVPQVLKNAVQSLKSSVNAQEASDIKSSEPVPQTVPTQQYEPVQPASSDMYKPPENNTPPNTCRVNGVDQPGNCEQYNKSYESQPTMQPRPQMNFQPQPGQDDRSGQDNNRGPDNERMLKDVKRGANDVARQLKQFQTMVTKFEKKGVAISTDTKTKIEELRTLITKFQSITSAEEIQDMNMDDMWSKMRDLEEERRNLEQMDNILREMKRIESSVKMFEKQISKLSKQKIALPTEITENLEKVKTAIVEIKAGKMENAEDIFDLVQNLNENRNQMEMLARWPQTLKEMNRQVKNLEKELKRAKTTTDRLNKKGIDISSIYSQFETAVAKLKEIRSEANGKITENAEDAFDLVQNDFFGQMDDVMENQRIIMTMGNFGQFQTDFTREMNKASQQIKALKKKKIDTSDLENLISQAKIKGAEVKELFKVKPLDPDAVVEALSEVENIGQEFDHKMSELTGVEEDMPWEKGQQQFRQIEVSPNLDKWIPRETQPAVSNNNKEKTY